MKKIITLLIMLVYITASAQRRNYVHKTPVTRHVDKTPVPKGDIQIVYEPISYNNQQSKKSVDRYKMKLGQCLDIVSTVHGSVGISVDVDYKDTEFSLERYLRYNDPESVERGLCGGDKATKTFKFTPLKSGIFHIVLLENYRGSVVNKKVYNIVVSKGKKVASDNHTHETLTCY